MRHSDFICLTVYDSVLHRLTALEFLSRWSKCPHSLCITGCTADITSKACLEILHYTPHFTRDSSTLTDSIPKRILQAEEDLPCPFPVRAVHPASFGNKRTPLTHDGWHWSLLECSTCICDCGPLRLGSDPAALYLIYVVPASRTL